VFGLEELYAQNDKIVAVIFLVLGIIFCFYGYKIFKITLGLTGFFAGAFMGMAGANYLAQGETISLLIGGVTGGAIGAILAVTLYMLGVFFIGALGGVLLVSVYFGIIGNESSGFVMAMAAIGGGVAGLVLQKAVLIFFTAFLGSWNIVVGTVSIFYKTINPLNIFTGAAMSEAKVYFTIIWFWIGLGIVGVFVQNKIVGTVKEKEGE